MGLNELDLGLRAGGLRLLNSFESLDTIDNFEAILYEDKGNTLDTYYDGDLSASTRQQTTVQEGSDALEISEGDGTNRNLGSFDTDGLPNYPVQGDQFRCWFRTDSAQSGADADVVALVFGLQNSGDVVSDRYRVGYQGSENFRLGKQQGGSFSTLAETPLTLSSNTWYEFDVVWETDGTITAKVFDTSGSEVTSGGISATDTSFTSGGVGYALGTPGTHTINFDDYRLVTQTGGGTSYFYDSAREFGIHGLIQPEGVYSADTNDTHITVMGADYEPVAVTYDHDTGSYSANTQVGDNPLTDDNHGGPALLRDSSGTLHCWFGVHGLNGSLHYATSDNADDTSSWTTQNSTLLSDNGVSDGGTYPLPIQTSTGDIYVFFRRYNSTERNISYIKSSDGGSTWNNYVDLATWDRDGSSYRLYPTRPRIDAGDNIWMTYNYTEGSGTPRFDQYTVKLDTSDDTVQDVSGTSFGSTITKAEAQDANNDVQAFDSGTDPVELARTALVSGTPHIIFGYNDGTWDYQHVYWDGSAWVRNTDIAPSNSEFNYAALSSDYTDTLEAHLTVSSTKRGGDIERWTYDGTSWTQQETVIAESDWTYPLAHPHYVRNGITELKTLFTELNVGGTANEIKTFAHGDGGLVERN